MSSCHRCCRSGQLALKLRIITQSLIYRNILQLFSLYWITFKKNEKRSLFLYPLYYHLAIGKAFDCSLSHTSLILVFSQNFVDRALTQRKNIPGIPIILEMLIFWRVACFTLADAENKASTIFIMFCLDYLLFLLLAKYNSFLKQSQEHTALFSFYLSLID